MPIALPCGQVLKSNLLSELLQDPQLRQSSQEFFAKPNNPVPATVRSLCCLQGEAATVCFQNQPDIVIGSTDATTCLIVAALCPQTRKAYITHHDTSTTRSAPRDLLACLHDLMTQPQLYLVGAYKEHSGASMGTLEALLGALHRDTSITVTVRLAAVWEANTDAETGAPRTRDLSLHCSSGAPSPAGFEDRGPELARRHSALMCRESSPAQLTHIAAHTHPGVMVLPRIVVPRDGQHLMMISYLLRQPDDAFLKNYSTSPDHEGPSFVRDHKEALAWQESMVATPVQQAVAYRWLPPPDPLCGQPPLLSPDNAAIMKGQEEGQRLQGFGDIQTRQGQASTTTTLAASSSAEGRGSTHGGSGSGAGLHTGSEQEGADARSATQHSTPAAGQQLQVTWGWQKCEVPEGLVGLLAEQACLEQGARKQARLVAAGIA